MASIVTPRIRFLHVPKTGGIWVMRAMLAAGVPGDPAGLPFHANLEQSREYDDRFTFAFVRHPLEFWRSYWAYKMRDGWDDANDFDARAATPDFDRFIDYVIADRSGGATAIFESFVGPADHEIEFIGRHERLVDDTCEALRRAGEPFDEYLLRTFPTVNPSDYRERPALYTRPQAERLAEYERGAIERFYPDNPIPAKLVDDFDQAPAA